MLPYPYCYQPYPYCYQPYPYCCSYQVIDQFSSVFIGASFLLLLLFAVVAWQLIGFAWPFLFASGSVDPLDF